MVEDSGNCLCICFFKMTQLLKEKAWLMCPKKGVIHMFGHKLFKLRLSDVNERISLIQCKLDRLALSGINSDLRFA